MKKLAGLLLIAFLLHGCSKESRLERRLDGTWNVTSLKVVVTSFFGISDEVNDIGTVTLNKDGSGKNAISYTYTLFDQEYQVSDNSSYTWDNTETTVTFSGDEVVRWTVDVNEKDRQVWTRTDGDDNEWEIELERADKVN